MTDERVTLIELVEKTADIDFVREMLVFAADRMMDAEVETETCGAKGAHTPLRGASATDIGNGTGIRGLAGSR